MIEHKAAFADAERIAEARAFLSDPDFRASVGTNAVDVVDRVLEQEAYEIEIADDLANADAYAAAHAASPRGRVTEPGLYLRDDGTVVKVQPSRSTGNLYAKVLRIDATDPGRSGSWEYVPGAVRTVGPADRMTLEQAEEFGRATGYCAVCGALLTDPKSIARGIGPVCAKGL